VNGFNLDDRLLLSSAFAEFTQEPAGRGVDQADATVPALTGVRDRDWTAFSAVYQQVTDHPSAVPRRRPASTRRPLR
jgi:carboxyl-terminal processing protease